MADCSRKFSLRNDGGEKPLQEKESWGSRNSKSIEGKTKGERGNWLKFGEGSRKRSRGAGQKVPSASK